MIENWADVTADRMVGKGPFHGGRLVLLGAADTGKTTLLNALADRLAQTQPVGLADRTGRDLAVGVIERWRQKKAGTTIRAPRLDIRRVRCLTIGDARIDAPFGWS